MGATIQLKTLIDNSQFEIRAQVVCAPLLGLALAVPKIKETAASILDFIAPQMTLWNEIRNQQLTRDPLVIAEFQKDSLRHDRISSGVYLGFVQAFDYIKQRTEKITTPSLWQIPEVDEIASSAASKLIYKDLNQDRHQMITYKDRKHELYNDLGREEVFEDLRNFLKSFLVAK